MLADVSIADKVGHHLEITRRVSCGEAFALGIHLILGDAVFRARIDRKC